MVESRRTYSSFVEQMRQESLQRLDANQQEQVILINQLIEVSRNAQGQRGITPLMWQAAFGGESARNGLNALLRFTQDINQIIRNKFKQLM